MRQRISDTSLEALLRRGDSAVEATEVSEAERAMLLARLAEMPSTGFTPRRRLSGAPTALFLLATAVGLAIFWPRLTPQQVARVVPISPHRVSISPHRVSISFLETVVTHIVIVADSTCLSGEPVPTEHIVIRGDATSVVTTIEPIEKTEVSL
ncbi:hypothetical protein [Armatimonas sp.]|uniref:hypothetical protein n=1 Tax=Armatimonas sp. TaxID=1872638 RepID=UPI00375308D6